MQVAERNTIAIRPRVSEGFFSAGHSARPSRKTQNSRPTNSRHLPDAAHAGEFEALVAEPEAEVDAAVLQRAEPAGGGRADDDRRSAPRTARRRRASAASARGPRAAARCTGRWRATPWRSRRCRPACGSVRLTTYGRISRERQAEERLAFDRVVRGDGAHADLQQHQADDREEVLARGLHRRRRPRRRAAGRPRAAAARRSCSPRAVQPQHRGDAGEQQDDARPSTTSRPTSSSCCRPAARAASCWCRRGRSRRAGRSTAAHEVQKKNAVSASRSAFSRQRAFASSRTGRAAWRAPGRCRRAPS